MFYKKIYLLSILVISGASGICNLANAADEPIELFIERPIEKPTAKKQAVTLNKEQKTITQNSSTQDSKNNKEDKVNNANNSQQTYVKAVTIDKIAEANTSSNASTQAIPVEETKVSFLNQDVIDIDKTSIQNKYNKNDASLWNRIRAGFAMPDLENEQTREKTIWYSERPEYFSRINERANKYLYHIVEELEKRKMPMELALLPIIESAFNPIAKSSAKAAGIWQFMPKTGKYFNLEQNLFVDERRDVLSSTTAALDYLQKLYLMFNNWHLALAAYNWGEGSVSRAIARNKAQGLGLGYTNINMPNETKYYVPKLQAVKNIIGNPEKYGIQLVDIPNHPYFVTVTTSKDIDVDLAAKLAEMPLNEFRAINPSFNKKVIIGATKPQILLPWEKAERFQENLKNHKWQLSTLTAITVNKREKVEVLADRFGVDASVIRSINNIGKGFRFRAGSTVLLPKVSDLQGDISEHIAENGRISTERDTPEFKKIFVHVYKKDTLSSIANRYDVSVSQIKSWNHIGKNLRRGQSLALVVPYNKIIHVQRPEVEIKPRHVNVRNKKVFVAKIKKKPLNKLAGNTTNHHKILHKNARIIKIADKKQHISRN